MPVSDRIRGWLAVAVAAAVLAGVAVVSLPVAVPLPQEARVELPLGRSATPLTSRTDAVRSLLSERAAAVRTRDEAAFLGSVDPKASSEFRESQRALFKNLVDVPLDEWHYEIDGSDVVEPPPLPDPAEDTWAPRVTLNYALTGVDSVPTRRSMAYVFAKRGDSWYLTGDDLLADQGRSTWRGPWDFAACRVRATRHGLVIGHDENEPLVKRLSQLVDHSVAEVTEVWGPDWSQQAAVLLPGSRAELRAMVGPRFAVDGIAAVAVADHVDPARRRVEGPRIVFNHRTTEGLSGTALRVVLQHEITHLAARADTVDGAPMWMLEGFADYVGYRDSGLNFQEIAPDLLEQLRTEGRPTSLPSNQDFHLAGRKLDLAYQQSWSVVSYIEERVGEQRLVALYRRVAGSTSPSTYDTALREIVGMSTAELVEKWGERLERHVR
ncbi:peptidase MA family metallohydrolase [Parasphingorhabdus pacifica]